MIEELRGCFMIGYVCIVTTNIRKKNPEEYIERLQQTKAYELTSNFFDPDLILTEVITGSYRKRKVLLDIIDTFNHNETGRSNPKGCLVIGSINDLGTTPNEINRNYTLLYNNDISVLVLHNEEFSSADYGGTYCKNNQEIRSMIDSISPEDIKNRSGRKKKELIVTEDFKHCYWDYENYFVPESIIYKNRYIQMTKVAFNQLCNIYEKSPEYEYDELKWERICHISTKPKRHGKITEDIRFVLDHVLLDGMSFEDALAMLNDGRSDEDKLIMTPITFARYVVKAKGARSEMGKATIAFRDEKIISEYSIKNQ